MVIEPVDSMLTHLIVKPDCREKASRLIPRDVVEPSGRAEPDEIVLHCSLAEFETFERANEAYFLAGASGHWGYRQKQMLSWPHYRLGLGGGPARGARASGVRTGVARLRAGDARTHTLTHGRMPVAGLQVHRGDPIQATDGSIGRVQGLIVDRVDHRVTHVLLDKGHLWGQKWAAIPIDSLVDVRYGLQIDLTKDQVRNLPRVELDVQE